MADLTLYSMPSSSNSCKVRLLLAHLGLADHLPGGEYGSEGLVMARAAGKMPLGRFPALARWLDRVAALPGHVPL